eukprot:3120892-Rhodomonas_salina.2
MDGKATARVVGQQARRRRIAKSNTTKKVASEIGTVEMLKDERVEGCVDQEWSAYPYEIFCSIERCLGGVVCIQKFRLDVCVLVAMKGVWPIHEQRGGRSERGQDGSACWPVRWTVLMGRYVAGPEEEEQRHWQPECGVPCGRASPWNTMPRQRIQSPSS